MSLVYDRAVDLHRYVPDMDMNEFLDEIKRLKEMFFSLIDDTAAASLVVYERKRGPYPNRPLSSLITGEISAVSVKVEDFSIFDENKSLIRATLRDRYDSAILGIRRNDVIESISTGVLDKGAYIIHGVVLKDGNNELELSENGFFVPIDEERLNHIWTLQNTYQPIKISDLASIEDVFRASDHIINMDVRASFICDVVEYGGYREFNNKNGKETKMLKLGLSDGTGNITLILWGDMAERFKGLKIGSTIEIRKASVIYSNYTNERELFARYDTSIKIL